MESSLRESLARKEHQLTKLYQENISLKDENVNLRDKISRLKKSLSKKGHINIQISLPSPDNALTPDIEVVTLD